MSHSQTKSRAQAINKDRLNPQFLGIAEKYSEHKRKRLESDDKRKKINSNYAYAIKFNEELERNLIQKQRQLQILQQARKRHNKDLKHKLQEDEKRRRTIEQLRSKCQVERKNLKQNIKDAKETLKADNYLNKLQTKQMLNQAKFQFQVASERQANQQSIRHRSIQIGKKIGNQRVNQFYRTQNLKSLNNYIRMIEDEDKKSDQNNQQINRVNHRIHKLELNINKKQNRLKNIIDEISMYSVETPHGRKTNHLANTTVYAWGYDTKPTSGSSRKRKDRTGTASSNRSKPSDILKRSLVADQQKNGKSLMIEQTI